MLITNQSLIEIKGWGGDENAYEEPIVRRYGPVDIDPGPYCCYVKPCNRLAGFRTQEALDRHIRLFH